jgi:hypothetical protein
MTIGAMMARTTQSRVSALPVAGLAGHSTMSNDDILKLAVQAGIHSAVVFVSHGSNIEALTHREQQDYAAVQHFARLLISALNKKDTA